MSPRLAVAPRTLPVAPRAAGAPYRRPLASGAVGRVGLERGRAAMSGRESRTSNHGHAEGLNRGTEVRCYVRVVDIEMHDVEVFGSCALGEGR